MFYRNSLSHFAFFAAVFWLGTGLVHADEAADAAALAERMLQSLNRTGRSSSLHEYVDWDTMFRHLPFGCKTAEELKKLYAELASDSESAVRRIYRLKPGAHEDFVTKEADDLRAVEKFPSGRTFHYLFHEIEGGKMKIAFKIVSKDVVTRHEMELRRVGDRWLLPLYPPTFVLPPAPASFAEFDPARKEPTPEKPEHDEPEEEAE